jgi:hypothetical protein
MTIIEQFMTMRLVRSRIGVDNDRDLVRIETRKCDRTGLVLTRTTKIPPSKAYLAAAGTED